MEFEMKKQLHNKASYTYGLLNILKCDIDVLRKEASDCNLDKLRESVREVDDTLQKLLLTVSEIEYLIKLDKTNSRKKHLL